MDAGGRAAVVVDAGSGVVKAGFASEGRPQTLLPCVVGVPKHRRVMAGGDLEGDRFVGERAMTHRGALVLQRPVEHGRVVDWDALTAVWQHLFDAKEGLGVRPEDQPMLMTEAAFTPRPQRERAAAVLFETLHVPALHFGSEPSLSLYGCGRVTGCVLDSGESLTRVVPVYEGFAVVHAASRMEYGGADVTESLLVHARRAGLAYHTSSEVEVLRCVKETACYVAEDPDAEEADVRAGRHTPGEYRLPDGTVLTLGAERFRAAEALFSPRVSGCEWPGAGDATAAAIAKCDAELRPALMQNVLLVGGSTAMRGFGARLLRDVRRGLSSVAACAHTHMCVRAPAERKVLTWVGGSILASLGTFRGICIRKAAWEEYGASILYSKAAQNHLSAV